MSKGCHHACAGRQLIVHSLILAFPELKCEAFARVAAYPIQNGHRWSINLRVFDQSIAVVIDLRYQRHAGSCFLKSEWKPSWWKDYVTCDGGAVGFREKGATAKMTNAPRSLFVGQRRLGITFLN